MKKIKETMIFDADVERCLEVLRAGGLIVYPTDTIWGIGCDATNATAVSRVYSLKERDTAKSMLVLIDDAGMLDHYVVDVPAIAHDLIDVAVKPLTVIYEGAYNVAPNLLGERDSLGIRITSEPFTHELCRRLGHPIVSTSANMSGEPSPRTFAEINPSIIKHVDYVVQYRRDDTVPSEASNIIYLAGDGTFRILR